ncbi:centromere protein L [Rhinophrynus dorsalis]
MQAPTDGVSTPKEGSATRRSIQFQSTGFPHAGFTSARKHTPFRLAPSKRRIQQSSPLEEPADPLKIAQLLNKQWTLYSVTPLHKFSYTSLKEYAKLLSAHITAEQQKGFAIEVGSELGLKATFSRLPGLKGRERDPGAILVQVKTKTQLSTMGAEDRIVWSGWFCCTFGEDDVLDMLTTETLMCLPLFLVNGTETLTALVGTWFQKAFDCSFCNLPISARDLAWMTAMWTGYEVHGRVTATELIFSVPVEPHMDISYSINTNDVRTLWNNIHKGQDEVLAEEVDLLFQCLYSHFFRHFKIHLSATQLVKVSTSVASAHCDGKVKFLCKDYLVQVLGLLTELAINNIQY